MGPIKDPLEDETPSPSPWSSFVNMGPADVPPASSCGPLLANSLLPVAGARDAVASSSSAPSNAVVCERRFSEFVPTTSLRGAVRRAHSEGSRSRSSQIDWRERLRTVSNDNFGGRTSDDSASSRIRVIEGTRKASRVETRRTVASLLLGRDSQLEHLFFDLAVRSYFTWTLWFLWCVGAISGLFATLGRCWNGANYGRYIVFGSVFMLPLPIFVSLVLCTDLVIEVVWEFEPFFLIYSQLQLVYHVYHLHGSNDLLFFWLCLLPSMCTSSFVDAYPSKFRTQFSTMFFTGLFVVYAYWTIVLSFASCVDLKDELYHHRFSQLKSFSKYSTVQLLFTVLAFCCRHLFVAVYRPDEFVIITSRVRTTHVNVELNPTLDQSSGEVHWNYVRAERRGTRFSIRQDVERKLRGQPLASHTPVPQATVEDIELARRDKTAKKHDES